MSNDALSRVPIVLDNGSGTIRAGFAGDDTPKTHFPSFVGRPKHTKVLAGGVGSEGDVFIGSKAQELRGLLKLSWPLEHGIVTDWEDMERIWNWVYREGLGVGSDQHPLLLTEPPLNPTANRRIAAEILFETFNIPALYTSIQAVLSLYASGRTTGLVLDSGDGVSHTVPVYEGFAIPNSINRIDVAGRDVTEHLQGLLRKAGYVFATSAEKEVVRAMKEKCCYLALEPRREEKAWTAMMMEDRRAQQGRIGIGFGATGIGPGKSSASGAAASDVPEGAEGRPTTFRLPDGNVLTIGAERFRAPEILFDPSILGLEVPGLHQLVTSSIARSDLDLRSSLYSSILLSGGTTLTKRFGERLLGELQRLAPPGMKVRILAPPERKWTTWIGGSILGGLSSFRNMWVTAEQYQEDPDIIFTKFT